MTLGLNGTDLFATISRVLILFQVHFPMQPVSCHECAKSKLSVQQPTLFLSHMQTFLFSAEIFKSLVYLYRTTVRPHLPPNARTCAHCDKKLPGHSNSVPLMGSPGFSFGFSEIGSSSGEINWQKLSPALNFPKSVSHSFFITNSLNKGLSLHL